MALIWRAQRDLNSQGFLGPDGFLDRVLIQPDYAHIIKTDYYYIALPIELNFKRRNYRARTDDIYIII